MTPPPPMVAPPLMIGMCIIGIGIRLCVALVRCGYAQEASLAPHRGARLAPRPVLPRMRGKTGHLTIFIKVYFTEKPYNLK